MCREKFDSETLDEQVNEECYLALRTIMPGYDINKLETEKKEQKAKPKAQATKRSKRIDEDDTGDGNFQNEIQKIFTKIKCLCIFDYFNLHVCPHL